MRVKLLQDISGVENIRNLGTYDLDIQLDGGVTCSVTVTVQ